MEKSWGARVPLKLRLTPRGDSKRIRQKTKDTHTVDQHVYIESVDGDQTLSLIRSVFVPLLRRIPVLTKQENAISVLQRLQTEGSKSEFQLWCQVKLSAHDPHSLINMF
jgi:hypothetical protein